MSGAAAGELRVGEPPERVAKAPRPARQAPPARSAGAPPMRADRALRLSVTVAARSDGVAQAPAQGQGSGAPMSNLLALGDGRGVALGDSRALALASSPLSAMQRLLEERRASRGSPVVVGRARSQGGGGGGGLEGALERATGRAPGAPGSSGGAGGAGGVLKRGRAGLAEVPLVRAVELPLGSVQLGLALGPVPDQGGARGPAWGGHAAPPKSGPLGRLKAAGGGARAPRGAAGRRGGGRRRGGVGRRGGARAG